MSDTRVSSFCHEGGCVEVEFHRESGHVELPGSGGPGNLYSFDEWRAFVLGVKAGEFDVPG